MFSKLRRRVEDELDDDEIEGGEPWYDADEWEADGPEGDGDDPDDGSDNSEPAPLDDDDIEEANSGGGVRFVKTARAAVAGAAQLVKAVGPRPPVIDEDGRLADIDDVPDDDPEASAGELAVPEPDPWATVFYRGPIERFAARPMPTLRSTAMAGRWWTVTLGKASVQVVVHAPQIAMYQLPPIGRGLAKWGGTYARWRGQGEWMEAAQGAEGNDKAKHVSSVKHRQRANARLTVLMVAIVLGVAAWLFLSGRGSYLVAALILILVLADVVGRKEKPVNSPLQVMPRSNFQEGAPLAMVMADVRAVLVECGHDTERLAVTEPRTGEYGISLKVHTPREIGEMEPLAIERGLQTYRGAVSIVGDPANAAITEVRIMWRDPLANMIVPSRQAPNSLSVAAPAELGYGLGFVPLLLNFMRTNIIIVGGPGSGKSSAFWACIDWLSCCHDVVLHGIDLSGGPALRVWGKVFESVAFTPEDAAILLSKRIASAKARTEILAERSEPRPGQPSPGAEHWTTEDAERGDGKFHIVFIDELPLMTAYPELCELLQVHQRIGRKAGETSVVATQDLSGATLGATALRKNPSTLIMLPCSREDVSQGLGGGKIKEGWTPHRFVPAEGDDPNDAGKCFIKSGRHIKPVPWRFARLDDIAEIHSRAIERIEAGRPADDDPPVIEEAAVIPQPLAGIADAFRAASTPEFLPTDVIIKHLESTGVGTYTSAKLAKDLEPFEVSPGRKRIGKESPRGYYWIAVETALNDLDES